MPLSLHTHGTCLEESFSGPIRLTLEILVKAVHYYCMHLSLEDGEQVTILIMTCAPFTVPEDLKVIIREKTTKICPLGNVPRDCEAI